MKLVNMTQSEFDLIKGKMIADYAKDKIKMGIWSEEDALELAKDTFNTILKKGVNTENQYLYNLLSPQGEKKAFVWFGKANKEVFVYNISFYDSNKGSEYSKELLGLIEEKAAQLDANRISYHMFGYREELIKILEENAYNITDVTLAKKI